MVIYNWWMAINAFLASSHNSEILSNRLKDNYKNT